MTVKKNLCAALVIISMTAGVSAEQLRLTDPISPITVDISGDNGEGSMMTLNVNGNKVMDIYSLGTEVSGIESEPWQIKSIVSRREVIHDYKMKTGKRRHCQNKGTEYRLNCSETGDSILVMRIYDDGIVYRYEVNHTGPFTVTGEQTTFNIAEGAERWLQEYRNDYEGFFPRTETWKNSKPRYGYPALFHTSGDSWALVSEANVNKGRSSSRLSTEGMSDGCYRVEQAMSVLCGDGTYVSPWRVVMAGNLADIVESTLITDVSDPSIYENTDWIKPGVVSWIYWGYNHGSKDYPTVIKYIDMAAELGLPYVLIDWEWDVMDNGGNIDDAIHYADSKGVKVLVWYNSSTAWTDQAAGPLFRLNKPADREKEFAWLESKGVAGVKIDFFNGDGLDVMNYCIDLLESAARHHLLVNFHGATIPRGWQRTYPNFMSAEAVYGAEWYNNNADLTPVAATHNTILPFTRNVIGPMDYTPCTFSDSQNPHITSHAHELALTVAFESGLQHLADTPESYMSQPQYIREFLSSLPASWDDTRLLDGFPGHHVALARKKDNKWYVALLNGTSEEINITPDWSRLLVGDKCNITMFTSKGRKWNPLKKLPKLPKDSKIEPKGGALLVIAENK